MTHARWNTNVRGSASTNVRSVAAFVFLGLASLASLASVTAGDNAPGLSPPSSRARIEGDFVTEVRAANALRQDEKLRPLNLHVKVTNGIAHISGPVPSAEFRQRAVHIVEQVPRVFQVRSEEVYIASVHRGGEKLTLPLEQEKPTQTRSASPDPQSGALNALTGREPSRPAPTRQDPASRPKSLASPTTPSRVTLLGPEAVAVPARAPEPTRLTANPRPPAATPSISAAIDLLRQSDARFRPIRTELQGGKVMVIAGDASGDSVMAFAQAITRVAGVQRVVVQDTSPRPR